MAYEKLFGTNFLNHLVELAEAVDRSRGRRLISGKDNSAVLKTQAKFDLGSVTEYLRAIKQFKAVTKIEIGAFYTFTYKFRITGVDRKHIRFYDYQPLILCFGGFKSNDGHTLWLGINFHRLPVVVRQKLVNALFKRFNINPQFSKATDKLVGVSYQTMLPIVKKLGFAVRNYRADRIIRGSVKKIPLSYARQLIPFYPETLYKASVGELISKYVAWRVGKPVAS